MKRYILVMLFAAYCGVTASAVYGSDWAHNQIHHTLNYGDAPGSKWV